MFGRTEPLIRLLHDRSSTSRGTTVAVQIIAATALGLLGDRRAVEPLIHLADYDDPSMRWGVTVALGNLGDERTLFVLLEAQQYDDDEVSWGGSTVWEAAARALAKISSRKESKENCEDNM